MKKLILLLLLASLCGIAFAQQQKITNHGYTSYWNPKTLIPDSVIWIAKPHKKVADRETGFHATSGRPNLTKDYAGSGYDIGHNCNAGDENGNATDEYNSFDYVNTFPQRPNNNRLTWLALENYTRLLNCPVMVKVYWQGIDGYIGLDKVTVPLYVIKELRYSGHYEKYVMPNKDTVNKHPFTFYKVN